MEYAPLETRRPVSDLGSHVTLLVSHSHTQRGKQKKDSDCGRQAEGKERRAKSKRTEGGRVEGRRGARESSTVLGIIQVKAPVPDYPHPSNSLQGGAKQRWIYPPHMTTTILSSPALLQRSAFAEYR